VIAMTDARRPEASGPDRDERTGRAAAAARMQNQAQWVDLQVRQAEERGDFADLPGAGKPIEGLGAQHDPDWWLKALIEREKITGVLPPPLQLRKDDLELDELLDQQSAERDVRREVEAFNARVVAARRQLEGGPPVVTPTRDIEHEVAAWHSRRTARREAQRTALAAHESDDADTTRRRRWWHRR